MLKLDLNLLQMRFSQAEQTETVSTENVNPYLLEHIIRPLLRGETIRYGDVDYDRFEDEDLRSASGYCDEIGHTEYKLSQLQNDIAGLNPCACKLRTFC